MRILILLLLVLAGCSEEKFYEKGNGGSSNLPTLGTDPAQLIINAAQVDFGIQSVFSFSSYSFVISNTGDLPATNVSVSALSGTFAWQGTLNNPCSTIPGKSDCTLGMVYHPTTVAESLASVDVSYLSDLGMQTLRVPVRGRGTNIAHLRISNGANTDFTQLGTTVVGTPIERSFDVLHAGTEPATGVSFSGLSGAFELLTDPLKTTCGISVSASCRVTVRFTPSAVGDFSDSFKVTYNNSSFVDQDRHTVMGKAVAAVIPPVLTLSAADYGARLLNGNYDTFLTLTFTGTSPAKNVGGWAFSAGGFSFVGGSFPGVGGTCPANGDIATTCTVAVRFNPTAVQAYAAALSFNYNDGNANRSGSGTLAGRGANPAVLTWTDALGEPVTFASLPKGKSSTATLRVTNASTSVKATGLVLSGLNVAFSLVTNGSCPAELLPGTSCNLIVRFLPLGVSDYEKIATLTYNDGSIARTLTRTVRGTGTATPELTFSAATLDFGSVVLGDTKSLTTSFTYYGQNPATITGMTPLTPPFSYTGDNYPGSGGNCPANAIVSSCTLSFNFSPQTAGSSQITHMVTYDPGDGSSKTISLTLRGRGVPPPSVLAFEMAAYTFSNTNVGATSEIVARVIKAGAAPATSVTITGLSPRMGFKGGSFPGTGGTCGTTISADCSIVFVFSPMAGDVYSSAVRLGYSDGLANRQALVSLFGTGLNAAALSFGSQSPDMGKRTVGLTRSALFNVQNTGNLPATVTSVSVVGAKFPYITSCNGTVEANRSCSFTFNFSSEVPGRFSAQIDVAYANGNGGNGTASLQIFASATIPVSQISANGNHTCGISDISQVKCWGQNNYGQLGLGNTTNRGDSLAPENQMGASLPHVDLGSESVKSLAVGYWHNCALLSSGKVKCWGWNHAGQLGIGNAQGSKRIVGDESNEMGINLPAVELGTGRTAIAIAAGYAHSCAILDNGGVKCWGQNSRGQLGLGDTDSRGEVPSQMGDSLPFVDLGGKKALKLSLNAGHSCAILEDSSLKCWGDNFYGQLGQGDIANRGDGPNEMASLTPVDLGTGRTAKAVSAGGGFTCTLLDNDSVKCFGLNREGTLGRLWCQDAQENFGPCTNPALPFPLYGFGTSPSHLGDAMPALNLGTGRRAVSLTSGNFHTCARLDNGTVKCWGSNEYGQLGNENTTHKGLSDAEMGDALPVLNAAPGRTILEISAGNNHTCARFSEGEIKCWGDNRFGALGLGDTERRGDQPGEMGTNLPFLSWY